jgi:hypothetical protein
MMKTKGAMREPAVGRGSGALPVQSPDVAADGNFADVGDCDVVLLKPHPEVVGSPQMQANGSGRIVCFIKNFGDRWKVRTQNACPHPKERLLLREKLLDHDFSPLPGCAGQGKDLRIMLSGSTAPAHAGAYRTI